MITQKQNDMNLHDESTQADKFRREYNEKHKLCPKCGSTQHGSTLMAFCLYIDKKEEYKDLNHCVCCDCGDRHTTHDRVSSVD